MATWRDWTRREIGAARTTRLTGQGLRRFSKIAYSVLKNIAINKILEILIARFIIRLQLKIFCI
jgi:hypothetical protein